MYTTPVGYLLSKGVELDLCFDHYSLTMAYAWWKSGMAKKRGVFNYFYRKAPYQGNYSVAMGIQSVGEFLSLVRPSQVMLDEIASIRTDNGELQFPEPEFYDLLRQPVEIDFDTIGEGSLAFPREPIIRFQGPIWQVQLWEGFLLNQLNFWSLIGTKASRMVLAANGKILSDGGLRRAQGFDGALTASIAAYQAGFASTSNFMARTLFKIPSYGTHAHSWVMSFDDEMDSFQAFARVFPKRCVLLLDTNDTINGTRLAAEVGKQLKKRGGLLYGVRMDSGALGKYSVQIRAILNEAGLYDTIIIASNDLDEYKIKDLEGEPNEIDIYSPGTAVVTGGDQSSLGGVMKLVAVEQEDGKLQGRVKHSNELEKSTLPGLLNMVRTRDAQNRFTATKIYDERTSTGIDGALQPYMRKGVLLNPLKSPRDVRDQVRENLLSVPKNEGKFPVEIAPDVLAQLSI